MLKNSYVLPPQVTDPGGCNNFGFLHHLSQLVSQGYGMAEKCMPGSQWFLSFFMTGTALPPMWLFLPSLESQVFTPRSLHQASVTSVETTRLPPHKLIWQGWHGICHRRMRAWEPVVTMTSSFGSISSIASGATRARGSNGAMLALTAASR